MHSAVSPPKPPRLLGDAVQTHATHDHAARTHGGHANEAASAKSTPRAHDHSANDNSANDNSAHAHSGDVARSAEGMQVQLALKAKCVCGCNRTRSQVGGGAARLGSVVLAAVVTGLAPAPVVVPEDRVLARWAEVHFDDDLVPI